jgi:hypothetical protein
MTSSEVMVTAEGGTCTCRFEEDVRLHFVPVGTLGMDFVSESDDSNNAMHEEHAQASLARTQRQEVQAVGAVHREPRAAIAQIHRRGPHMDETSTDADSDVILVAKMEELKKTEPSTFLGRLNVLAIRILCVGSSLFLIVTQHAWSRLRLIFWFPVNFFLALLIQAM